MKSLNYILFSLFIVFSVSAGGTAEAVSEGVSGTIEGGLRVLQVDSSTNELEFTIYRGDYIVFDFESAGKYDFKIPELDISTVMPAAESEQSYVKMKESGNYSFTLGSRKGIFHVKELEASTYHELTAAEADVLIDNVNPLILDVRTSGEYKSGHIPGAELLPVQIFAENLNKLEEYKDEDIFLYCASGNRSTVAARMLIDAGFTKVYNLRRGISDWARNGYPVE